MHYQKYIHRTLVVVGLLLLIFSCHKADKKHPIQFTIKSHIPYSGEPISGVKYTITEYRSKKFSKKLSDIEYTDFKLEGYTNTNGLAVISFLPKKSLDYMYRIDFDYSKIQFSGSSEDYSLINAPAYDLINRDNPRDYEIRALPHCSVHFKIENINCFDSNDKMRFKTFNMDEFPNQSFQYISVWSNDFNGCAVNLENTSNDMLSGRKVYQIEVTRNGQVTTYIDTFFLQPGIMNEVFLEY
ncbi:hypothetical protein [Fluviicola sp.]|uniref:hypothetical protein n=1 Tax=Fluviicola sp. TaxID=1917219 RepID=UPI0031CEE61A